MAEAQGNQYRELTRQLRGVIAVNRELARCLPHDLPPAVAGMLTLLLRHGETRMSRLAELLGIDVSVTSRQVAHAADRGWITRHPDPRDGRSQLLRISTSGEQLLDDLAERTSAVLEHVLEDWSEDELAQLNGLLDRLRKSFGRSEDCRQRAARPGHPAREP